LAQFGETGHDLDTGVHRALCIVLVGLWITEIDQNLVADVFGDVAVVTPNDIRAVLLIGAQDLAQVFRVEPLRVTNGSQ